jgi:hypothetical protein
MVVRTVAASFSLRGCPMPDEKPPNPWRVIVTIEVPAIVSADPIVAATAAVVSLKELIAAREKYAVASGLPRNMRSIDIVGEPQVICVFSEEDGIFRG